MATIVSRTIGTGGDYSTPDAWFAACPANLVTADQVWQGLFKNEVFSSATTLLTLTGITTSVSCFVDVTTDVNASYLDNQNVRTNALRYNEANGAALKCTGTYYNVINNRLQYTKIRKLQLLQSQAGAECRATILADTSSANISIDSCIIEGYNHYSSAAGILNLYSAGGIVSNSIIVNRSGGSTTGNCIAVLSNGASAYNCSFVNVGATTPQYGIRGTYGTCVLKNCYVGGVTTVTSGSSTFSVVNSATDLTASGWTTVPLSTATFESITNGTHDLRLKAGSALIGAGVVDATYSVRDISGSIRGSSNDIGAWQYAPGAVSHSLTFANSKQLSTLSAGSISQPLSPHLLTFSDSKQVATLTPGSASQIAAILLSIANSTQASKVSAGSVSVPAVGDAAIAIPPIYDWGTHLPSTGITGVQVDIRNISTGVMIVRKTGLSTDVITAGCSVSDPLIPHTTLCEVVVRFPDGSLGIWDLMSS